MELTLKGLIANNENFKIKTGIYISIFPEIFIAHLISNSIKSLLEFSSC